jgi:choline dehydrogenase
MQLPRARILGGSTTINGCIWLRGSRLDYDGWAARGNPGWGFDDLLPYFRRAEADPFAAGSALHGTDGPVPVWRHDPAAMTPVDRAFLAAAEEIGFDPAADLNEAADQRPSVGPTPKNIAGGARMNAAFTYLAAARGRTNLDIVPDTAIDRVEFDSDRAVAVLATDGRRFAGDEIVLAGGAYGSPAILLRSGVGPATHLRELGIPVVRDLPGVGEQLLDHPVIPAGIYLYTVAPEAAAEMGSFIPAAIKARSGQVAEDIDLHIYPIQYRDGESGAWCLTFAVSLMYSRSRGRVRLTSADSAATLHIDHNYCGDPADLEALCDGAQIVERLVATPPLAGLLTPTPDTPGGWDRARLGKLIRETIGTTYHPSSSCSMGPASDPLAVVDAAGRVHGLRALRVVDASVFPTGPRCNLHFPVVAVAERLAQALRDEG